MSKKFLKVLNLTVVFTMVMSTGLVGVLPASADEAGAAAGSGSGAAGGAAVPSAVQTFEEQDWQRHDDNPVLELGQMGSWDNMFVGIPDVMYKDGEYKMWYTGDGQLGTETTAWYLGGDQLGGKTIGYATSPDGITWTKDAVNPILELGVEGAWDSVQIGGASVLFEDGEYKMWYMGYDGEKRSIGYATSVDGITWSKHSGNPILEVGADGEWDSRDVAGPSVYFDGTEYKMWYAGRKNGTNPYKIGYATSPDGITWTKDAANPILERGDGEWEESTLHPPHVIYNSEEEKYEMWYSGGSGEVYRIGHATSTDGGATWTKDAANPVLDLGATNVWDDYRVLQPTVILQDGTYKMWYSGEDGSRTRIGYAESVDGVNWVKPEVNAVLDLGLPGEWDSVWTNSPYIIKNGTEYKMWYRGFDGEVGGIGHATSQDGITWTKDSGNPVIAVGEEGTWDDFNIGGATTIMFDGTEYKMWYAGYDEISWQTGYATSPDGIAWTKYASNPVLDLGEAGQWDDRYTGSGSVMFDGTEYKMWYIGLNDRVGTPEEKAVWQIGYADSPDGITWTKDSGNPILTPGEAGDWDDTEVFHPNVIFEDDTYKMWYRGYDGENRKIGYAESIDGITWTKDPNNPVFDLGLPGEWDDTYLYAARITPEDSGYKMWYEGGDGTYRQIGYATLNFVDTDADGVVDEEDNCSAVYNPDQEDLDGDEVGDICDEQVLLRRVLPPVEVASITIDKLARTTFGNPGDVISYTITIVNTGNVTVVNLVLEDVLSSGFSFIENEESVKTWELGDLLPGEEKIIDYDVKIDETLDPDVYANIATAQADNIDPVSITVNLEVREVTVLGEEYHGSPEEMEGTEIDGEELSQEDSVCPLDCQLADLEIYIINPDGSESHLGTDFVEEEYLGALQYLYKYEDKGDDMDYDDLTIQVAKNCPNYVVQIVSQNGKWEHQVVARIKYKGNVVRDEVLWNNSKEGLGQEQVVDLRELLGCREIDEDFSCQDLDLRPYIVNPDGTSRHMGTSFVKVDNETPDSFTLFFEDKGVDIDYDDLLLHVKRDNCSKYTISYVSQDARWQHQVRVRVYLNGIMQNDVSLWLNDKITSSSSKTFNVSDLVNESSLDSDGDGLADRVEGEIGTDLKLVDSDGDGVEDGLELEAGTSPLVGIASL